MVKHRFIGKNGILWVPPGGGMEFGKSAEFNLLREIQEETGLNVKIEKFLFIHEYLEPPLHAIELFFKVIKTGGILKQGIDPEMGAEDQIIEEVKFMDYQEILAIGTDNLHHIFSLSKNINELLNLRGYFKFEPVSKIE